VDGFTFTVGWNIADVIWGKIGKGGKREKEGKYKRKRKRKKRKDTGKLMLKGQNKRKSAKMRGGGGWLRRKF
jgi:hypothetical protein